MNRDLLLPRLLRGVAVLIALLAAIDPALTSSRVGRPTVTVLALDPTRDSALTARVTGVLADRFTVLPVAFAAADATVLVGDGAVSDLATAGPVFAVTPAGPRAVLEAVEAPATAFLEARVPVTATVRVSGARGRSLGLLLAQDGTTVDRSETLVASDDTLLRLPLTFVPTTAGLVGLRLSARIAEVSDTLAGLADLALDVRDQRRAVLFYDPRPSWMSTFVRRALEEDRGFVVTSRVVTSTNLSSDAGTPPGSLDNLVATGLYDVVAVGSPDALSERDVAGLEAVLRRRGGQVALLLDGTGDGPWQRLLGAPGWRRDSSRAVAFRPVAGDTASLRATDIAWPVRLPPGAEPLALGDPIRGDAANHPAVIWRLPVGAGTVIVSGALDSWRSRDPSVSGFSAFWRHTLADAAASAVPPLTVTLLPAVLRPGEEATVHVTLRDPALRTQEDGLGAAGLRAGVTAMLGQPGANGASLRSVRLRPDGAPGEFTGRFRAPADTGAWRLDVTADVHQAAVAFLVRTDAFQPAGGNAGLRRAWVAGHGGEVLGAGALETLPGKLLDAIDAAPRPERWHPMRSLWWLLPFALCLSAEWWLRRQRGMA